MTVKDALKLVLGLAAENVLEEQQCDDDMLTDREKQLEACDIVGAVLAHIDTDDDLIARLEKSVAK